jgi:DNA-binding HxlR family transcriptional regulator
MEQVEKLDFPKPIASTIEALNSDIRRNIMIHLGSIGALPYSTLRQKTGLTNGRMNYHLKILTSAGMIRNFLFVNEQTGYSSYYEVTPLGKSVIEGIFSAFRPIETEIQPASATTWVIDTHTRTRAVIRNTPDSASDIVEKIGRPIPVLMEEYR